MGVRLRPVQASDGVFRQAAFAGTRERELAALPAGTPMAAAFIAQQFAFQQASRAQQWPAAAQLVVLADGEAVGLLTLDRSGPALWWVVDLALLPAARGGGTGSAVMRLVLAEATAAGKRVGLHVDRHSPARRFYDRLGFVVTGEDDVRCRLEWAPPAS